MRVSSWISACLLSWIIALSWATSGRGGNIYVDNRTGDDRFNGHAAQADTGGSGPVRTLAQALKLVNSGDHVILAKNDEPYRESISLVGSRMSGGIEGPLTIEGHGSTIDGAAPVPVDAWEHYQGGVFRFRTPHGGNQMLFLDGRPLDEVWGEIAGKKLPNLDPLQWFRHKDEIFFRVEQTKLPRDYALSYASLPTGITLYQVERVVIADLVVQGYRIDGINAANSAGHIHLSNVICRGNGRSGLAVGGASIVQLDASLAGNNGEAQLLTLPCSHVSVHNSRLLSNTAPAWVDRGGTVYVNDKAVAGGLKEIAPDPEKSQLP
jgi:hypothetical protein